MEVADWTFCHTESSETTENKAVDSDIESTNRIPKSISEWFDSLPGEPRLSVTGDEGNRMRGDLEAILKPTDDGHEGGLKLTRCADGSFRVDAVESEETRKFD